MQLDLLIVCISCSGPHTDAILIRLTIQTLSSLHPLPAVNFSEYDREPSGQVNLIGRVKYVFNRLLLRAVYRLSIFFFLSPPFISFTGVTQTSHNSTTQIYSSKSSRMAYLHRASPTDSNAPLHLHPQSHACANCFHLVCSLRHFSKSQDPAPAPSLLRFDQLRSTFFPPASVSAYFSPGRRNSLYDLYGSYDSFASVCVYDVYGCSICYSSRCVTIAFRNPVELHGSILSMYSYEYSFENNMNGLVLSDPLITCAIAIVYLLSRPLEFDAWLLYMYMYMFSRCHSPSRKKGIHEYKCICVYVWYMFDFSCPSLILSNQSIPALDLYVAQPNPG